MKTKRCLYPQPNHLLFRTAIVREQKQFIKIVFAVHLSAVISAERYRSDSITLKSAVSTLVYFYILCNNKNYEKASEFLRGQGACIGPLSSYFEDRKGHREG